VSLRLVPDDPLTWQAVTFAAWRDHPEASRIWQDGSHGPHPDIFAEGEINGETVRGLIIGGTRLERSWDAASDLVLFTDRSTILRFNGATVPTLSLRPCPRAFEEVHLMNDTRSSFQQLIDNLVMKTTMTVWFMECEAARRQWQRHLDRCDITVTHLDQMPVPTQMVFLGEGLERLICLVIGGRWNGMEEGFNLYHPVMLFTEHHNVIKVDPCEVTVRPVDILP